MGPGIAQALLNLEQIQMAKRGYLIHEDFSPRKSIRKLRQVMKGELK